MFILQRSYFISFLALFNTISLILKKWRAWKNQKNDGWYEIGTFGRNELITKYKNKLIWACLDLLTIKTILLLSQFYILCLPFGKGFCRLVLIMCQRHSYNKGQDIWESSLFPKNATFTIKWKKEILSNRSVRPF